ncbi:MFS transporter [Jatrophihabitans telluris]|uniref:MFS transporter n=1 Tax=Jatrophihabitans telluris TaxID=2038343 RepID=A0ABY4R1I1_9ACTN|nr:MFS transporter [Jatrophihabitans telluris]UQX89121.1 MFS transporter [Jatrophihabitans telluris]
MSDNGWDDSGDGFSPPTYHRLHPGQADPDEHARPAGRFGTDRPDREPRPPSVRPEPTGDVTVTRAVVARSRYLSKLLAHKVISASQADGARESGLTAMIWNQVMSYGADAMITVALAGTVFFSAPSEAQRGNVLLYLLMTMAPFAVVAPVIGPALDRVQHGRRIVMAATALGRAVLAVVMAMNFTDLYVLFPAALGSLVLSKAYAVIRAAATPRLVPTDLTLVEANGRLSIFGLAAALVGGGLVGVAIKTTGSYPFGLWITAVAFAATAFYAFRLPRIIDTLPADVAAKQNRTIPPLPSPPQVIESRPGKHTFTTRLLGWAGRGFTPPVVLALQGESTLRWLSGFLTLFLAFHIEAISHGWHAVASLGAMGVATGAGNFIGTGIGTRLKLGRPDLIILVCNAVAAVACLAAALLFSLPVAIGATLVSAISNALAKLSLDALVQRDVPESLRSSAFGRSETFLQLSWVLGATVAILLPAKNGPLGFGVAAGLTIVVATFMALRERAVRADRRVRTSPQTSPR